MLNSCTITVTHYGECGPSLKGSDFSLDGQEFFTLNGGPEVTFIPAISFVVNCDTQAELDEFWSKLSEGGHEVQCGWLQDKYGVSWQIVPRILGELLSDPDEAKSQRVMRAMLQMIKLDIAALQRAYDLHWEEHTASASGQPFLRGKRVTNGVEFT
ncbi:MAG TPA: VOC family protein [Geobacteraceae bacterium]